MKRPRFSIPWFMLAAVAAIAGSAGLDAQNVASNPLAERSVAPGSTRFTELPADRTGVTTTNAYDDPRMWAERHTEYAVGAIGTGVAVGDFDRDGRPDFFVVSKVESGRLYRNLGDWHFEDVTAAAGVGDDSREWKQGAAFVDVNNDGWLDLYVCRFGAPNQLFMNRGDGTFNEEAAARGLAIVDASGMACFADYDCDGWLDVYLQTNLLDANRSLAGQPDHLLHNRGDGTFVEVTAAAGMSIQPTQGHSATWWDQNEDGWPDLYVANDFSVPDFLYRNNRDGTFTNVLDQVVPHTPFSSMGADCGDINNDGHLDLFVPDMAGTTYEFTQRGLADTRARQDAGQNERRHTAAQVLSNALYLGTGMARVPEVAHLAGLAGTDWTWSPRFADLDNDGRLDLVVTNGMDREQNNLDLTVKKLSSVNLHDRIRLARNSPVLRQHNLAYANRGDLHFEEVGAAWGLDQLGVSFGSALADFDNDGDLDLVFTNYQAGVTLLRNDSASGHAVLIDLRGTTSNRYGLGARVEATTAAGTQVRELISARGYLSTSEPVIHFGLGEEDVIQRLHIRWPSGREQILENLPADRRYTVTEPAEPAVLAVPAAAQQPTPLFTDVSATCGLELTQREEPLEGTVLQPLLPFRFNRRGPALAVGDFNGDGVDELVVGATVRDGARLLWRSGNRYQILNTGKLGAPPPLNGGPVLIFDANGDGANDLLLTAGGAALPAEEPEYEPQLWLNSGQGGLDPAPAGFLPSLPISAGAAVAADFDRDGHLDLFLGGRLLPGYYPEPATSALLLQRNGRMQDATEAFAPALRNIGLVTSALASDVDGDGWVDLVVTLEWGGVHLLRNQAGRGLADESARWGFASAGTGMWSSVAAADFNRDGRLDYVVGNLGLNTLFQASAEQPLQLFVHDFAGSGTPQLVLAIYDQNRCVPVASRDELAARIPAVRRRFASNDRYAASSLADILGAEDLARADVYRATELRSGVLLSQPDGTFRFAPLPSAAQIAPLQGVVAEDFDGDGQTDLLAVTNDYAPIPAVGRFDSGLGILLRGDGRGGFAATAPTESGWLVPGAAKALVVMDLDHNARPDVVVTRNDDTLMAFRTANSGATRSLALRLRGQGGNPDAIGARVQLLGDGRVLAMAEVHAGEGYASQSAQTVFMTLPTELPDSAKLRVRWPSGTVREFAVPAESGYLDLVE